MPKAVQWQPPPADAFFTDPVDALPNGNQDDEIHKNGVQREKSVGTYRKTGIHHQEQEQPHPGRNGPDAPEIAPPVMGMGKPFHGTE